MSFFGSDYSIPRKRRSKVEYSFPPSVRAIEVRRLSDTEPPPYDQKVFLTKGVPRESSLGSLPGGLIGHVPTERDWEKSDKTEWKTKKLCLVTFPGRGTFQVPISALALG